MAAQFRRSGLTVGEFVRQTGVSRRMVLYWTQRERELASNVQAGFVDVTPALEADATVLNADSPVDAASEPPRPALPRLANPVPPSPTMVGSSSLEITLPRGAIIKVGPGFDPVLLRTVVSCLETSPC